MRKALRFIWPLLLLGIGIAFEVAAVLVLIPALRDKGTTILVPGNPTFTITAPGDYTLWNETRALVDGQFMTFPDHLPPGITVSVVKQPEGTPVPLRSGMSGSMEDGDNRRVSIGDLTFTAPGQYEIVLTGLADHRAFYLDQAHILRAFLKFGVLSLLGMFCFFAALASGFYAFVRLFGKNGNPAVA